jgi:hypothetical protein
MTFINKVSQKQFHEINHAEINRQDIGWNEFSREKNKLLCDVDMRKDKAVAQDCKLRLQGAVKGFYNGYHFHNLYANGDSSITVDTNLNIDPSKKYYLNLDHCSTLIDGVPSAEINIIVNGEKVVSRFNPQNGGNFRQQHFDITDYLVSGNNNIVVQLDDNSVSQYWIHTLCVYAR